MPQGSDEWTEASKAPWNRSLATEARVAGDNYSSLRSKSPMQDAAREQEDSTRPLEKGSVTSVQQLNALAQQLEKGSPDALEGVVGTSGGGPQRICPRDSYS